MYTFTEILAFFFIYAFLGWCMEVTIVSIENKKIMNRGFLIGPYCPIHGYGGLLIILVLNKLTLTQ